MSPAEAQVLLTMCAAVDNRKPDADAARAWAAMLDDLRFEDCRVAVIEHFKTSTDWLMPAKVRADVKRVRAKRIAEADQPVPPDGLTEAEELAWIGEARRRIGNGEQVKGRETPAIDPNHGQRLRALLAASTPKAEVEK